MDTLDDSWDSNLGNLGRTLDGEPSLLTCAHPLLTQALPAAQPAQLGGSRQPLHAN